MRFPEKLVMELERSGKSQSRLQRETGIAQSAISAMTRGDRRPYLDQAFALARALGVGLDYLADDDLDAPPSPVLSLSDKDQMIFMVVRQLGHEEAMRRLVSPPAATNESIVTDMRPSKRRKGAR